MQRVNDGLAIAHLRGIRREENFVTPLGPGLGLAHAPHTNSRFGSSLMNAGMLPR
jgi:hypothetical protein